MTQKEAILAILKRATGPLTRAAILDQVQDLGHGWRRDAVASTLTVLQRRGLIGHPEGVRDGWLITNEGMAVESPTLVQPARQVAGEDEYDEDYLETGDEEEEDAEANKTTTAISEEGLPNAWSDVSERLEALEQRRVSHDDTHTVLDRRIARIEADTPPHDCRLVTHSQLLSRLDSQRGHLDNVETAVVTLRDRIGALEERLSAVEWSPRRWAAELLDDLAEWVRGDE